MCRQLINRKLGERAGARLGRRPHLLRVWDCGAGVQGVHPFGIKPAAVVRLAPKEGASRTRTAPDLFRTAEPPPLSPNAAQSDALAKLSSTLICVTDAARYTCVPHRIEERRCTLI